MGEIEFIQKTIELYKDADRLAKDTYGQCYYSKKTNGVGCAIGCHLPDEVAEKWDDCEESLDEIYESYPEDVEKYFPGLDVRFLAGIQIIHDTSSTVSEFIHKLEQYEND